MSYYIYIAEDKDKGISKIGIALCPRCRIVDFNNGLRHRFACRGNLEVFHKIELHTQKEARKIEKMALNVCKGKYKIYCGKETFFATPQNLKGIVYSCIKEVENAVV